MGRTERPRTWLRSRLCLGRRWWTWRRPRSVSGWRPAALARGIACRPRRSWPAPWASQRTLRLALERLESNGEVNRRQGSGTFVGRVAMPAAFSEGLEVLESYTLLARRQGKRLTARNVSVEQARPPGYVAEALGVRRGVGRR